MTLPDPYEIYRSKQLVDYDRSLQMAKRIDAQEYRCWYNSIKAIKQLPALIFHSYTEGWLVVPQEQEIQVIEHGWISCPDGRVLDPSIVLLEPREKPLKYFPALDFPRTFLLEIPPSIQPPFAHLLSPNDDELGDPAYRAAYDAALTYAEQLGAASGKPVGICPCETTVGIVTPDGTITFNF